MVEEHDGILFVNPGSPTIPRNIMKLGQVAILDLTPGSREARIIDLATLD
jgi:predicted phosphodiesterase